MAHMMPPTSLKTQKTPFDLPGHTLPFDWIPRFKDSDHPNYKRYYHSPMFPVALNFGYLTAGIVDRLYHHRETVMMRIMNEITEKPGWESDIFNEAIISQWWREFSESDEDFMYVEIAQDAPLGLRDIPDMVHYQKPDKPYQDVTPRVMTYLVKELRWRSSIFRQKKTVNVFDGVVKSDEVISSNLRRALINACDPLERGPRPLLPNADSPNIFNPIDPSLYPLVYGRTRILPDRLITRENCISTAGNGTILTLRRRPQLETVQSGNRSNFEGFQYLPCNVSLSTKGCQIVSYINNAHPVRNREFYDVLEKVIAKAIPMWNVSLQWIKLTANRIPLPTKPSRSPPVEEECTCRCHGHNADLHSDDSDDTDEDDFDDHAEFLCHCSGYLAPGDFAPADLDRGQMRWVNSGFTELPEPTIFEPRRTKPVNLKRDFHNTGIQVIVKLETIELTPQHPTMPESVWHLAGQPNEHICASAVYCYDMENMEDQPIGFRHRMDYGKRFHDSWQDNNVFEWPEYLRAVFRHTTLNGRFGEDQVAIQGLGNVLIHPGRLLTFPNYLQHQRSAMSLADDTKPGHCKLLFLFLVDPHMRIISTANVPVQREDWTGRQRCIVKFLRSKLPMELVMIVMHYLLLHCDEAISQEESEFYRWKLQEDRKSMRKKQNRLFETGKWR